MKKFFAKIFGLLDYPVMKYVFLIESVIALMISPIFLYGVMVILCFATDSPDANNMFVYSILFLIFCTFLLFFWAKFVVAVVLFKKSFIKDYKPSFENSFKPLFIYDLFFSFGIYALLIFILIDY